ncbi:DUF695 domain-containing protein [Stenotrophomonas sp. CFBP 13724]|uniref:DUF695 domain-containing protein n=1 Tax=Stenotrophomonas sp. CFBP 13724 TaxID=2775298 RepID=UPI00178183EB|nr:DUF695 domain-containing protein [Stenotrophomonas sp. CFBP 13724]MBD8643774.1 DUF695 domain-containing protein [Stenotrophomonas sp. CFBP 13724]
MIPKPHYTLINTSKGDDPAVVVVNSSLRNFQERASYAWNLNITIDCEHTATSGMPTAEESEILIKLEEIITKSLQLSENAAFLARTTCRGMRTLIFRVRAPEIANDALQMLISEDPQLREWEYIIELDPEWTLAQPELSLIEKSRNIN